MSASPTKIKVGWTGLDIAEIVHLDQIARAHELVEHPAKPGRVIVALRQITALRTSS